MFELRTTCHSAGYVVTIAVDGIRRTSCDECDTEESYDAGKVLHTRRDMWVPNMLRCVFCRTSLMYACNTKMLLCLVCDSRWDVGGPLLHMGDVVKREEGFLPVAHGSRTLTKTAAG